MPIPENMTEEAGHLNTLSQSCRALAEFAQAISGTIFQREGNQWVSRPDNFVTMTIQHARAQTVVVCVRGNPTEFRSDPALPFEVRPAQAGYSRFTIEHIEQLAGAADCIERAWTIYQRGRNRQHTQPHVVEHPV